MGRDQLVYLHFVYVFSNLFQNDTKQPSAISLEVAYNQ